MTQDILILVLETLDPKLVCVLIMCFNYVCIIIDNASFAFLLKCFILFYICVCVCVCGHIRVPVCLCAMHMFGVCVCMLCTCLVCVCMLCTLVLVLGALCVSVGPSVTFNSRQASGR